MPQKKTTSQFILDAVKVHGDKYDYSQVEYIHSKAKVKITCKIHGLFFQTPNDHLRKNGCPKCSNIIRGNKIKDTQEEFIEKCIKICGIKYDYSLVNYINSRSKINIICPHHGIINVRPVLFLNKGGCFKCGVESSIKKRTFTKERFIVEAKKIHGDKYDYSESIYVNNNTKLKIICPTHGIFLQTPIGHIHGKHGCVQCASEINGKLLSYTNEEFIEKAKSIHGEFYNYRLVNYRKAHDKITIICPKHGEFSMKAYMHLQGQKCRLCSSENTGIERFVKSFLTQNNIKFTEKDRNILNGKEIDIVIKDKNIGIECNGLYWHSELRGTHKNYHFNKSKLAKTKNIDLIQIFENEIMYKPKMVINRLRHLLGKTKYKIFARKCEIKHISRSIKDKFLEKYHTQGKDNSDIDLGLFYKNRLVSVMTFCKLMKYTEKEVVNYYELSRFCSINNFSVIGGASKLLSYFEKKFSPKCIISYADKRWSNGNVYHKLGFKHSHNSPPNYWYFKQKNIIEFYNSNTLTQENINTLCKTVNPKLTEWENMKNNLWNRVWDCGYMIFEKHEQNTIITI